MFCLGVSSLHGLVEGSSREQITLWDEEFPKCSLWDYELYLDWELDYGVVLYCDVIGYECKCEISYALKRFMNEHSDVYNFQMSCLPIWGIERLWPG